MKKHIIIIAFVLICTTVPMLGQATPALKLTADEVMATVFDRDNQRERLGGGYSGNRAYALYNHRLNKRAELVASVVCDEDGEGELFRDDTERLRANVRPSWPRRRSVDCNPRHLRRWRL